MGFRSTLEYFSDQSRRLAAATLIRGPPEKRLPSAVTQFVSGSRQILSTCEPVPTPILPDVNRESAKSFCFRRGIDFSISTVVLESMAAYMLM